MELQRGRRGSVTGQRLASALATGTMLAALASAASAQPTNAKPAAAAPSAAQQLAADIASGRRLPPITPIAAQTFPGEVPLRPSRADEGQGEQWDNYIGGRIVRNVVSPTLTPVMPAPGKATGAAVIVAPGGAFMYLGMDGEGFDVARKLADRGITAFVLKYRTKPTPRDAHEFLQSMFKFLLGVTADRSAGKPQAPLKATAEATQDGEAAVRLVRSRAKEWGVDPNRVGFIGFSAGAMTALSVGLSNDPASRPDFIASLYGPPDVGEVPAYAPPLFAATAMDDPLFSAKDGGLLPAWSHAKRPIEAHFYEHGGHGFAKGTTSENWFEELYLWMKDRGQLKSAS